MDRMNRRELFTGLYKRCECNCGALISIVDKQGRSRRFKKNHDKWKGGRYLDKDGYWRILIPNYHRSDKRGYVLEHVYIYEKHYQLCMLPWGAVHHKDGNKENNKPESNLQGMMKKEHIRLHSIGNKNVYGKHQDTSDRQCYECKSTVTNIYKPKNSIRTPYPRWCHLPWDKENWYCMNCYNKKKKDILKDKH